MIALRALQDGDLWAVADNMRAIERVECRAGGHTPILALTRAVGGSHEVTVAVDGEDPIAIFGLYPVSLMQGLAAPWMLGTDAVARHGRALLTLAPPVLARWQRLFPRLENHVHRDNGPSIRWLTHLGFTVEAEVVDIGGEPHRRFWKG